MWAFDPIVVKSWPYSASFEDYAWHLAFIAQILIKFFGWTALVLLLLIIVIKGRIN